MNTISFIGIQSHFYDTFDMNMNTIKCIINTLTFHMNTFIAYNNILTFQMSALTFHTNNSHTNLQTDFSNEYTHISLEYKCFT